NDGGVRAVAPKEDPAAHRPVAAWILAVVDDLIGFNRHSGEERGEAGPKTPRVPANHITAHRRIDRVEVQTTPLPRGASIRLERVESIGECKALDDDLFGTRSHHRHHGAELSAVDHRLRGAGRRDELDRLRDRNVLVVLAGPHNDLCARMRGIDGSLY